MFYAKNRCQRRCACPCSEGKKPGWIRWHLRDRVDRVRRGIGREAATFHILDRSHGGCHTRAIEDMEGGRLAPDSAANAINAISQMPPYPTWFFALAAGAGAA